MFCRLCIDMWMKKNATCPVDRKKINLRVDLIAPDRTVVNMLNKLKIKCEFESKGCIDVVQLEIWKKHVNECDFNPANKWKCEKCQKIVTRKSANNHRCVGKLEIEIIKLKQQNERLRKNFESLSQKFELEKQTFKQKMDEKNNWTRQLIKDYNENQKKLKILENENELLKSLPSTSTRNTSPQVKTNPLVVKSKQVALANIGNCSSNQLFEDKTTTTSIDKWHILRQLPSDLKSRVCLASVLMTETENVAMIITKDDQAFWFNRSKTAIGDFGRPIKIDALSGKRIKSLMLSNETIQSNDKLKYNVLALTEGRRALTWSYNKYWTEEFFTPNFVNLNDKTAIEVCCSYQHTLALTSNGEVFAWGENRYGQLGTGSTDDKCQPMKVIKKIESLRTVAVACCQNSSFALIDNGDVFAWGENSIGQLGIGNNTHQTTPTRIEVLAGIKIRRLACGWCHVLAVADNGSMFAWGFNCSGQLGNGDHKNMNKPVKIGPSGIKFIEVAAFNSYSQFSVALSEGGRVWVWGRCRTEPKSTDFEEVLYPKPVKSTSIHDAIAEYSQYQSSWKTMVIRQQ